MDPKYHIIFDCDDNDNDSYALLCRGVDCAEDCLNTGGPYTDNDNLANQVRKRSQPFFEVKQLNMYGRETNV